MKKELTIIPVPDARLVPRYLLEQVKDRRWTVDEWYQHQIDLKGVPENIVLSMINKKNEIVGIVWLTIDGFEKYVHINTLSVDKRYQSKSKLIKFVTKYIRDLAKALKLSLVGWTARRTKALERYGFEESEFKIMEERV
jgi:N-acetylglutamate synthase-like GNAT family acetyltransferase